MPFNPVSLGALIQGSSFTLWHYRTTDSRAVVAAPGYFDAVAASLKPGDLMVVQTSDALALLPIRLGATLGTGVTLDGAIGPFNTVRSVTQGFSFTQAAAAVVRTIVLAPIAGAIIAGSSIPVSASVTGPITEVVFTLRDANDAILPPARIVAVVNGGASTSFSAPPVGTGYRIRVEDSTDPSIGVTSPSFSVGMDLELVLQESDARLLIEGGGALRR